MAKAIKLMNTTELHDIAEHARLGVPVNVIVRVKKLNCSSPTLSKLIHNYQMLDTEDKELYNIINKSLFPPWIRYTRGIVKQDTTIWSYKGKFPLGFWVRKK